MASVLHSITSHSDSEKSQKTDRDDKADSKKSSEKSSGGKQVKSAHIIAEHINVGVPPDKAYDQWTQYDKWSEIFKKESAESGGGRGRSDRRAGGGNVKVSAKIGPSQRQWTTEIVERSPGRRIAWRAKGGVQAMGVTTFHRLDDRLTHLMVEIEYRPSGFFETVGNFFRMQRRRVRKDLKLFKNYIELREDPTGSGPGRLRGDGLRGDVDKQTSTEQED